MTDETNIEKLQSISTKPINEKFKDILSNAHKLLEYKNSKYGNAALAPLEIFTGKTTPLGLGVRLDDKLSRVKNAKELRKNDLIDIIGYLTLLCAANNWTDFSEFMD